MQKKFFAGRGAPISLDYAEFLGTSLTWTFSFVLCLDRFPILYRYYSDVFWSISLFLLIFIICFRNLILTKNLYCFFWPRF